MCSVRVATRSPYPVPADGTVAEGVKPAIDTATIAVNSSGVLPRARGPVTETLFEHLERAPHALPRFSLGADDAVSGDDSALALYTAYELHYRSFAGVDDGWEWEPTLLRERARLETAFERRLLAQIDRTPTDSRDVVPVLAALAADGSGPSLSTMLSEIGTLEQLREFAIHRSAYQLKEADPHTWAIPRLDGRAKAALVDIQTGEYGDGNAQHVHAKLFADAMRALRLDPSYGAYLDRIPGATLATVNLVSLLGLHRRWRGALVGHLALFEMCSVVPMGRYAHAMRRLGAGEGSAFYDAHVVADARHEKVALHEMAGALAADEPELASDIVIGARALAFVENAFAVHLLQAWANGRSSLLAPAR
jgi:hypothetical protein